MTAVSAPQAPLQPVALTVQQAVMMSTLSRAYVYRAIAAGKLETVKAGRRRLVMPDALTSWIKSGAAAA